MSNNANEPQSSHQDTELDRILRQFELWLGLERVGEGQSSAAELVLNRQETKAALKQYAIKERLDELKRLDTGRHYGKGYQESLDELDDYKLARALIPLAHVKVVCYE